MKQLKESALARFRRARQGAISVEIALLAPIMMTIAFATYDLAAVTQSRDRAQYVFYSLTDAITSRTDHLTCQFLDQLGDLAYEAFKTGNAGALNSQDTLPDRGASDFRFQIRGLKYPDVAQNTLPPEQRRRVQVMWAFHRTGNLISRESHRAPGEWISIPPEYRVPGEFYVLVEGRHFFKAPLNLFSMFQNQNGTRYHFYLSPRYVSEIDLIGPEVNDYCENDGV